MRDGQKQNGGTNGPDGSGENPSQGADEQDRLARQLSDDVHYLCQQIGQRNMFTAESMYRTTEWITSRLRAAGYEPQRQTYELSGASVPSGGWHPGGVATAENLSVELTGSNSGAPMLIIGAHYDSVAGSPGANDNGSAVATLLALAERMTGRPGRRTIRFVFFANEEPPFFLSEDMGSYAYARRLKDRGEQVEGMVALDGLGCYSDEPGSQQYPAPGLGWMYPDRANFIGMVTRLGDRSWLNRFHGAFERAGEIDSYAAALPSMVPGVYWSDHWSFWQYGFSGLLVTDTLPFRDQWYHSPGDTPERLDYRRMAQVALGLQAALRELAG